ncbi:methionine--tRNA ligase, cytoplasmic [Strongylocentrotus purpuratus]|uniref:Methionine--tRNA ligase, cytoplasmic n=1 Tax=Strongylocentrotus purpuratus TaxID=7668 RepID=A0A7M7NMB1_STRPU|nr:methionine--tRNA ligase, cytoplasmic [Strongylocentrotus purpuratus]
MKIYSDPGNQHTLKAVVAAALANLKLEIQFTSITDSKVPYLKRGKLPVLEISPNEYIFSANNICRYILSNGSEQTWELKVEEWVEWESTHLQALLAPYLTAVFGGGKKNAEPFKLPFCKLNDVLANKQYLVGTSLTAADIVVWCALYPAITDNPSLCADYKHLQCWFQGLASQESFQKGVATVTSGKGASAFKEAILSQHVKVPLSDAGRERGQQAAISQASDGQDESKKDIPPEEIAAAKAAFTRGKKSLPKLTKRVHPVLPQSSGKNILITSALPYVNNVPHLGTIIGCVLSGDVFSRFCRLRNYNTLYICGTDEYGTATETKALEEGLTPQQICDKYHALHRDIYKWFNIDFDHFGRTTTQKQTEIAQDIFHRLHAAGHILEDTVEQLQCQKCNRFLADRFVEGICPLCSYEDARGDQCDKCGKLINATDLKQPRCKVCSNTPVIKTSRHLFLDLPKLAPALEVFLKKSTTEGNWSANAKLITNSWVRDGLKPRCITRDLKWGTPVPLKGYTDKVFYVWYDAPIGYPSITANYTDQWEKWWKNPQQVQLYNFMAKDNVPFHSVIFPSCLIGANDNYTMVNHLIATEYLNYEDTKFSKSRGIGVFGDNAQSTGIPADIWRFYLLYIRPETQDSAFSWADFVWKNNSELLNNLGNFINRGLTFLENSFGSVIPEIRLESEDERLIAEINRELKSYIALQEKVKIRDALKHILNISRLGNQHIQACKPWVLVKGNPQEKLRAGTVIGLAANISCLLSVILQPFMPETSATIQAQLQAPAECYVLVEEFVCYLDKGHKIGKPSPLFSKIEPAQAEEFKKRFAGKQQKVESAAKPSAAATPAPPTSNPPTSNQATPASPQEIERLTAQVTAQGEKVRKVKGEKADKAVVDAEVKALLDLKRQLAIASGLDPDAASKSKGKSKKKGGKK